MKSEDLETKVKTLTETVKKLQAKVQAQEDIEAIKKLQKDGLSEDICKDAEKDVQDITDKYINLVEKHLAAKEKEIMAV